MNSEKCRGSKFSVTSFIIIPSIPHPVFENIPRILIQIMYLFINGGLSIILTMAISASFSSVFATLNILPGKFVYVNHRPVTCFNPSRLMVYYGERDLRSECLIENIYSLSLFHVRYIQPLFVRNRCCLFHEYCDNAFI